MLGFLNKHRPGETLLEVIIALFVLATTSSAATLIITQSSGASLDIQKNFQARYLAREAFEFLKMVRSTNWIRFTDRSCWDIEFNEKECSKQLPKRMVDKNDTKTFGLVSGGPGNMYFQLKEPTGNDPWGDCTKFNYPDSSPHAVYKNNEEGLYEGMLYSPDPVPPADQKPMFCRKIELTKNDDLIIRATVHIAWQSGKQLKEYIRTLDLYNY